MKKKPVALIILDGFGDNKEDYGNAIHAARKPNIDRMMSSFPTVDIGASGMDVGLPEGQMGNSEVGHTNIGAGRIVYQELTRISQAAEKGEFLTNKALSGAMENCKKHDSALHLMGLLSDGGVHSHISHLYALLKMAKQSGLSKVYVHAFMDGRDVAPTSGVDYVRDCLEQMKKIGTGTLATLSGRYYAMDRDNRWERVQKVYDALVYGKGEAEPDPVAAMEKSYAAGVTDEFVVPVVCRQGAAIRPNDSVIFFNFRPDRARELTRTLTDPELNQLKRREKPFALYYVCMTQYDATMPNVCVAFEPEPLTNTLGEYVSSHGMEQLRIAETEKYAHVTFFFNGGVETEFAGEDRVLIKSPLVATYDMQPEMSAYLVADELVKRIESGKYDMIICNFANCDMVGHTGVFSAAVRAVEAVDECLGRVLQALDRAGGAAIVTADHGNADRMYDQDGSPFTAHTTNPVPLTVVGYRCELRSGGRLADIAPTLLEMMGLPQPKEMTGKSLIVH